MAAQLNHICLMAVALAALLSSVAAVPGQKLLLARNAQPTVVDVDDDVDVAAATPLSEKKTNSRLAGLYMKEGNENGQLRFLASGLTSTAGTGSTSLNTALNQYITNKQNMLEQLRPVTTTGTLGTLTGTGTGTATVTGTGTTGTGVTTTANGAIIVNAGSSSSSSSSSALNSAIYGSSPIADLLPQIVAQSALRGGNNNRRRQQQQRRRVVNRQGGNAQRRRRVNQRGKNKKRPQVTVVRPNRG